MELSVRQVISQLPAGLQQQWTQAFAAFKEGWNEAREYHLSLSFLLSKKGNFYAMFMLL